QWFLYTADRDRNLRPRRRHGRRAEPDPIAAGTHRSGSDSGAGDALRVDAARRVGELADPGGALRRAPARDPDAGDRDVAPRPLGITARVPRPRAALASGTT